MIQLEEHRVFRLLFELEMEEDKDQNGSQDLISRLIRYVLIDKMSEAFSHIIPQNKLLKIDQLTLDLGDIYLDEIEQTLPNKFYESLLEALRNLRLHAVDYSEHKLNSSEWKASLQLLEFFLEHGSFPWWNPYSEKNIPEQLFGDIIKEGSKDLLKLFYQKGHKSHVKQRMYQAFSSQSLNMLLQSWNPNEYSFFQYCFSSLSALEEKYRKQNIGFIAPNSQTILWGFFLEYLRQYYYKAYDRSHFLTLWIQYLAQQFKLGKSDIQSFYLQDKHSSFREVFSKLAFTDSQQPTHESQEKVESHIQSNSHQEWRNLIFDFCQLGEETISRKAYQELMSQLIDKKFWQRLRSLDLSNSLSSLAKRGMQTYQVFMEEIVMWASHGLTSYKAGQQLLKQAQGLLYISLELSPKPESITSWTLFKNYLFSLSYLLDIPEQKLYQSFLASADSFIQKYPERSISRKFIPEHFSISRKAKQIKEDKDQDLDLEVLIALKALLLHKRLNQEQNLAQFRSQLDKQLEENPFLFVSYFWEGSSEAKAAWAEIHKYLLPRQMAKILDAKSRGIGSCALQLFSQVAKEKQQSHSFHRDYWGKVHNILSRNQSHSLLPLRFIELILDGKDLKLRGLRAESEKFDNSYFSRKTQHIIRRWIMLEALDTFKQNEKASQNRSEAISQSAESQEKPFNETELVSEESMQKQDLFLEDLLSFLSLLPELQTDDSQILHKLLSAFYKFRPTQPSGTSAYLLESFFQSTQKILDISWEQLLIPIWEALPESYDLFSIPSSPQLFRQFAMKHLQPPYPFANKIPSLASPFPEIQGEINLEESPLSLEGSFRVSAAGIILIWPYLSRLFEHMGLLNDGSFENKNQQSKAIYTLAYLASGETDWEESELLLAKLLCGFPLGSPLIVQLEIDEELANLCEGMLQAVIGHWSVLGETSSQSFRQSFLLREASLHLGEEEHVLEVDTQAYDVLLSQLPWSISLIQLSWMEKPLSVIWQ